MNTWHVVDVGYLSRNKFWGEIEHCFYHPVQATTTVIQSDYGNIVVDPSMDTDKIGKVVFNGCGIRPENIDIVYCTHMHNDHWAGLGAFPNAKVYMPKEDLEYLQGIQEYMDEDMKKNLARFLPIEGELVPGFSLIHLPGHTRGLHGLLFEAPEGRVLIAGDSVMGKEFFQAGEGYFYSYDMEDCAKSIRKAENLADYIVPGHGNYFKVKSYPIIGRPDFTELKNADRKVVTVGSLVTQPGGMERLRESLPPAFDPVTIMLARDLDIEIVLKSAGFDAEKTARWKNEFL